MSTKPKPSELISIRAVLCLELKLAVLSLRVSGTKSVMSPSSYAALVLGGLTVAGKKRAGPAV